MNPADKHDSEDIAISIKGLTKRFGKFVAVDNMDMAVRHGDFMGLLGPNGSGKSTSLKCVTGLIKPTAGEIMINGIPIGNHKDAMKSVGCVIETPEPYMSFTPIETLDYIGKTYGMCDRDIALRSRDILEKVKLWDWKNKKIGTFSKGMRQRTVIAQALLSNPKILILDEPTSGLDPRGMIEMRKILSGLKKEDTTMLISTHILKEVSELCGYVTIINHGRTVASGDVNELIRKFNLSAGEISVTMKTYRPMTPEFLDEISASRGVCSSEIAGSYEIRLRFNGSEEDKIGLSDIVHKHGMGLLSMEESGTDIESLYMEVIEDGEGHI